MQGKESGWPKTLEKDVKTLAQKLFCGTSTIIGS